MENLHGAQRGAVAEKLPRGVECAGGKQVTGRRAAGGVALAKHGLGVGGAAHQDEQVLDEGADAPLLQREAAAHGLSIGQLLRGRVVVHWRLPGQGAQLAIHKRALKHGDVFVRPDLARVGVKEGVTNKAVIVFLFAAQEIIVTVFDIAAVVRAGNGRHGIVGARRVCHVRRGCAISSVCVIIRVELVDHAAAGVYHARVVFGDKPHVFPAAIVECTRAVVHGRRCHADGVIQVLHASDGVRFRHLDAEAVELRAGAFHV